MAAQQPARASPELRVAPLSPRYRRNYTTLWGTTGMQQSGSEVRILQMYS